MVCRKMLNILSYKGTESEKGSGAPALDRAMQKPGFDVRVLSMLLYACTASACLCGMKKRVPS